MTYTVLGTDCSIWQDDSSTPQHIDFTTMLASGAKFVFIKVSQATFLDRDYTLNWANAKRAGIPRGGYHYLVWSRPMIDQARFFSGALKADPGELPPVVDFEEGANCPRDAAAQLEIFCTEVERMTGERVMIYTSPGFWKAHGSTSLDWLKYKLWIAHYTTNPEPLVPLPWSSWSFWQYTSRGNGPQYGAEEPWIDLNWYSGSLAEFTTEFGLKPPPLTDKQKIDIMWSDYLLTHPQ
jgi:lysozyme